MVRQIKRKWRRFYRTHREGCELVGDFIGALYHRSYVRRSLMGNVILGLLLVGYIVVTIVNLVIEVKRDKETRPLRIRESRSQMYLAFELARFNKNIEKAREEAEK